jgi:hypothetical protein
MFDFIKRMFGEGKIRAEIICADGTEGIVKMDYIGDLSTLDLDEFAAKVKQQVFVKYGRQVVKVNILGAY